jgi:hypothetical protein
MGGVRGQSRLGAVQEGCNPRPQSTFLLHRELERLVRLDAIQQSGARGRTGSLSALVAASDVREQPRAAAGQLGRVGGLDALVVSGLERLDHRHRLLVAELCAWGECQRPRELALQTV